MNHKNISATTKFAILLGWPVNHSKSPDIHNAAFEKLGLDAVFLALPVTPKNVEACMTGLRVMQPLGASVTKPHKIEIMKYCDQLSPSAQAIGAVNALEFKSDHTIIGHNTDALGFVRGFEMDTKTSFQGNRIVILGGGGAAQAVHYGVIEAKAAEVRVIVRNPKKVDWTNAEPWNEHTLGNAFSSCDTLIDCTSIGLLKENERKTTSLPLAALPSSAVVSTLVYHRETALLQQAQRLGLQTSNGVGMLVHQGAIAFEIWTGQKAPLESMYRTFEKI